MARKKPSNKKTAGIRGEERRLHFESGGSLREWRGSHVVHTSIKRNNRKNIREKAIKDSEE